MLIRELLEESESKGKAPYGVIFDGDDKAYVGVKHGVAPTMSDDLRERLEELIEEHGIWYEGSGDDAKVDRKFFGFGKDGYEGAWDDEFAEDKNGFPYQFIYTLFSNTKANGQLGKLESPRKTIFDSIMSNQRKFSYFSDGRRFTDRALTRFLKACSDGKHDFLEMSEMKATRANLKKFLNAGEKAMWPTNWESYPNKAGKVAKLANDDRNRWLLGRKRGVYVMGSGHLLDLKRLKPSLRIIGGERA